MEEVGGLAIEQVSGGTGVAVEAGRAGAMAAVFKEREAKRIRMSQAMLRSHARRKGTSKPEQKIVKQERMESQVLHALVQERDALNVAINTLQRRGL